MSVALLAGIIPRGGFLSSSRRPSQPRSVRASRCMAAAVPEGHPCRASDWLELDGKVALITGGASGLGSACATELARHGVKCVLVLMRDAQRRFVARFRLVRCSGAGCQADATAAQGCHRRRAKQAGGPAAGAQDCQGSGGEGGGSGRVGCRPVVRAHLCRVRRRQPRERECRSRCRCRAAGRNRRAHQ